MAEGVGFEPTDPCGSPVFKTGAIDHSAIPPMILGLGAIASEPPRGDQIAVAFTRTTSLIRSRGKSTESKLLSLDAPALAAHVPCRLRNDEWPSEAPAMAVLNQYAPQRRPQLGQRPEGLPEADCDRHPL
jgi:hypothetical protein